MRILYLCHRIPYPPDKGEKTRAFHQLRALSERHQVDLFALVDNPADLIHRAELQRWCASVTLRRIRPLVQRLQAVPFLLTGTPLTLPCFHSAALQSDVRDALRDNEYDVVFVYSSAMFQYVRHVAGIPIVTDLVDVDSDKWNQYSGFSHFPFSAVYRREWRTLASHERTVCRGSVAILVTTQREARVLAEMGCTENVHVAPNGVDANFFSPGTDESAASGRRIVFTGDMSYFPNVNAVNHFARNVLPLIRKSAPRAEFVIVGRNPHKDVLRLRNLPSVTVTGAVPDVRPWLRLSCVSVAPFLIAAGIQTKILEALAAGVPVVATTRATQGLPERIAACVDKADDPASMAKMVVALLAHPRTAREKGRDGRRLVMADCAWSACLQQLLHVVECAGDGTHRLCRAIAGPP